MPNINLIAARRAEKRRMERLTRQTFFGMTASIMALVGLASWLTAQRLELGGRLAAAEKRMDRLKPALSEIDDIQRDMAEKKPKVETLETARLMTLRWCSLFNALSRSLPADTWVERMDSSGTENTQVTLNVVTRSQTFAGQTAVLMGAQPIFQDVNITSTQASLAASGNRVVRFEVTAGLRAPVAKTSDTGAKTAQGQKGDNGNA